MAKRIKICGNCRYLTHGSSYLDNFGREQKEYYCKYPDPPYNNKYVELNQSRCEKYLFRKDG